MTNSDDLVLFVDYDKVLMNEAYPPLASIVKCSDCKYCIMTEVMNGEEVYGCNRFGLPVDHYLSACSFGERKERDTDGN